MRKRAKDGTAAGGRSRTESATTPRRTAERGDQGQALVTGATSLLGRLAITELLGRTSRVWALLRPTSAYSRETLAASVRGCGDLPWQRVAILRGDVLEPDLALGPDVTRRLREVTTILHLARPRAHEAPPPEALLRGLDGVIELARRLPSLRRLVVLSSNEIAGDYGGRFYEDWLDIGQSLTSERARAMMAAEKRARDAASYVPICVVRHGLLVGHSRTGQIDCEAGLERLFAWGNRLSRLPSFLRPPGPGPGERYLSISPVDFVAQALVEVGLSGQVRSGETFCLSDPAPPTLAALFELLLDRVGAPPPGFRFPVEARGPLGRSVQGVAGAGARLGRAVGRGPNFWSLVLQRGEYDVTNAQRVLEPAGVTCPRLPTYFDALFEDYCRRHRCYQA